MTNQPGKRVHICNPSMKPLVGETWSKAGLGKKHQAYLKNNLKQKQTHKTRTGGIVQAVNACQASTVPWVQTLLSPKNKQETNYHFFKTHLRKQLFFSYSRPLALPCPCHSCHQQSRKPVLHVSLIAITATLLPALHWLCWSTLTLTPSPGGQEHRHTQILMSTISWPGTQRRANQWFSAGGGK